MRRWRPVANWGKKGDTVAALCDRQMIAHVHYVLSVSPVFLFLFCPCSLHRQAYLPPSKNKTNRNSFAHRVRTQVVLHFVTCAHLTGRLRLLYCMQLLFSRLWRVAWRRRPLLSLTLCTTHLFLTVWLPTRSPSWCVCFETSSVLIFSGVGVLEGASYSLRDKRKRLLISSPSCLPIFAPLSGVAFFLSLWRAKESS